MARPKSCSIVGMPRGDLYYRFRQPFGSMALKNLSAPANRTLSLEDIELPRVKPIIHVD
jgi:hypothetical protein